jgi:hypothetical protein
VRSAPTAKGRDWTQIATSIGAIGALALTAVSLYLTTRENAHQDNIAEQGQITNRYTAAIDQLDSNTQDIRLGGIYALERIMDNSPVDQPTIGSVLSAFIRSHPPGHSKGAIPTYSPAGIDGAPPEDIKAAMAVLGDRDTAHDGGVRPNLSGTNLSYLRFDALHLPKTTLVGAKLIAASLTRADLTDADLTDADFSFADLTDADLTGPDLTGADLGQAHLIGADLYGTLLCSGTLRTKPERGYRCS